MRRLTVGIDASRGFGPEPTGTETYANEVIRALVARAAHDYRLYLREAPLAALPAQAEAVRLGCRRLWTHICLAAEVRRRPPDVLFVPAHVLPWRVSIPAVVTVHDLGHRVCPHAHTLSQRLYLEWSCRHHLRAARFLIADSMATRNDLVRFYHADPERIAVVHLGVSRQFRPANAEQIAALRAAVQLPAEASYLAHVGTLQPRKNLDRLVRAFAILAAQHPNLWLILVGRRGWGRVDPQATARRLGVGHRVRWLGYLPRERLPALYSGAVVTVFPSLYEGFGLPALEAMACGGVVAASAVASLPEVVGEAGLLFDPTDELLMAGILGRLVEDGELRRCLSERALVRAARFDWARCAAETQTVLERAANEDHRAPTRSV